MLPATVRRVVALVGLPENWELWEVTGLPEEFIFVHLELWEVTGLPDGVYFCLPEDWWEHWSIFSVT